LDDLSHSVQVKLKLKPVKNNAEKPEILCSGCFQYTSLQAFYGRYPLPAKANDFPAIIGISVMTMTI